MPPCNVSGSTDGKLQLMWCVPAVVKCINCPNASSAAVEQGLRFLVNMSAHAANVVQLVQLVGLVLECACRTGSKRVVLERGLRFLANVAAKMDQKHVLLRCVPVVLNCMGRDDVDGSEAQRQALRFLVNCSVNNKDTAPLVRCVGVVFACYLAWRMDHRRPRPNVRYERRFVCSAAPTPLLERELSRALGGPEAA